MFVLVDKLQLDILEDVGGWGYNLNTLMNQLKGFKGSEIVFPINSYGGSVLEGLAMYNIIAGRSEKTTAAIIGYAMSMGTIIPMGADVVTMPQNGYFMVHNPLNMAVGNHKEMEAQAKLLLSMKNEMVSIYKKKTNLPESKIIELMDAETWLTAKEAHELGFVDTLTEGAIIEASFSPTQISEFNNIPKGLLNVGQDKNDKMAKPSNKFFALFSKLVGKEVKTIEEVNAVAEDDNALNNAATALYSEHQSTIITTVSDLMAKSIEEVKSEATEEKKAIDLVIKGLQDKVEELAGKVITAKVTEKTPTPTTVINKGTDTPEVDVVAEGIKKAYEKAKARIEGK